MREQEARSWEPLSAGDSAVAAVCFSLRSWEVLGEPDREPAVDEVQEEALAEVKVKARFKGEMTVSGLKFCEGSPPASSVSLMEVPRTAALPFRDVVFLPTLLLSLESFDSFLCRDFKSAARAEAPA